jgi:hypothetical protein
MRRRAGGNLRANRRINGRVHLGEANKHVRVVALGIRSRVFEDALYSVNSGREISSGFHVRESWSHQHEQGGNDADDDEQFEQRKTPNAFGVTLFCAI